MSGAATVAPPGGTRLGRLVRRAGTAPEVGPERCELCGAPMMGEHRHLLDVRVQEVLCTCRPCGLLFDHDATRDGRYRAIPERRRWVELPAADADLQALGVPVGSVFFTRSSVSGDIEARFPSPAGPTEAPAPDGLWGRLVGIDPGLADMEADVEALLVHRVRGAREHWLVPIDDCFRFVALFRQHWRGISGGDAIWTEVQQFFDGVRRSSTRRTPGGAP